MANAWERVYTDAQLDALAFAYEDAKIRPAPRVVELAAAGQLKWEGETLAPFKTNANTVRDAARKLRKRRAGDTTSELSTVAPRDAIEMLRRRLINVADAELRAQEKRRVGSRDPERLRQIARLIREAQAIPGPTEPRQPAPGQRRAGERTGGETRGGMAGALIAAHRSTANGAPTEPATAPTTQRLNTHAPQDEADHSTDGTPEDTNRLNEGEHNGPGSLVIERAAEMGLDL